MVRMPMEERRARLLDAAYQVMLEQGVTHATTRTITSKAQMPLASFHYVFESHEQLMITMLTRVLTQNVQDVLQSELEGETVQGVIARVLSGSLALLETQRTRQQVSQELVLWSLRHPEAVDLMKEHRTVAGRVLGGVFMSGAEKLNVVWKVPVEILVSQYLVLWDGLVLRYLQDGDAQMLRDIIIPSLARSFEGYAEPVGS